jgi:ribosomal protein S18 acetylase RimI-like enzyme
MRPGRPQDLDQYIELWRGEVRAGRQDVLPVEARMRRILSRFDWEARSRVVEDGRQLAGAVLLMSRPSPEGVLAGLYVAGSPRVTADLVRWALQLSRAAGATVTQTFVARGQGGFLHDAGMRPARPWWRMDRTLLGELPRPAPVPGYGLLDATLAPAHAWADMFNRSFADHWRFTPRAEEEIVDGRPPELCLMAVTSPARSPVAIAFGEVEAYREDQRLQPVGLVSSVGTLPEHRRRGLAGWLVAEVMQRLRRAGARTASLYVDGMNTTRAFDVYQRLGFEVAFEADVWEATFP